MKLGTKGRYAVMAMADMACQPMGEPVALMAISARQNISLSYLEQLFNRLRKAGLVRSIRGARGGYVLARPAAEINVARVMEAVAEPMSATGCDGDPDHGCRGTERCITHDLWHELDRQIEGFLLTVSLADVVGKSGRNGHNGLSLLTGAAKREAGPTERRSSNPS